MAPISNYYYNFPYFPVPPSHHIPHPPKVLPPPPLPRPVTPPTHPFIPPPPHNTPNLPPHNPTLPPPPPPPPIPKPVTPPSPTNAPPPYHPVTPPRPLPPPPHHPFHPPSPPNHPIFPPPPPSTPTPTPAPEHHSTVIVVVFVSLGGLVFLAFLSVALCCFIKKRKKKSIQKTEVIDYDEHMKVQEEIIPGAHGEKMKVLTIEEDVHIVEKIKKNEKLNTGSASHDRSLHVSDVEASSSHSDHHHLEPKV